MNADNKDHKPNLNYSKKFYRPEKFRFVILLITGIIFFPTEPTRSEEIFLKCTGKFEINRGELIKPDWETSYLTINLDGLTSSVDDKGIQKEGRTSISFDSYRITHRDNRNRIKAKYNVNGKYGTYIVDYPQINRTLIGTCQKSRG